VLHPYPDDLVIATKVGGTRDEQGGWLRASRPEQLREQVEHDLKLLKVDRLGLVNMRFGVGTTEPDPVPLADQVGVLSDLRDEGKLDLIGVSTVSADMITAALEITPVSSERLRDRQPHRRAHR
jgi:pyridoxine 4-dehydrogenase